VITLFIPHSQAAPQRRHHSLAVVAAALGLSIAGSACRAADSAAGLGPMFRPQAAPAGPTSPGADAPGENPGGLRVVVASRNRTLATIDGKIVHVGDEINGMRVARIDRHGVLLVGEGGTREELSFSPQVVVKRSQGAGAPATRAGEKTR